MRSQDRCSWRAVTTQASPGYSDWTWSKRRDRTELSAEIVGLLGDGDNDRVTRDRTLARAIYLIGQNGGDVGGRGGELFTR